MAEKHHMKSKYNKEEVEDYIEYLNTSIYIVWGCTVGLLLIVLLVLLACHCIRRNRNRNRRMQFTGAILMRIE